MGVAKTIEDSGTGVAKTMEDTGVGVAKEMEDTGVGKAEDTPREEEKASGGTGPAMNTVSVSMGAPGVVQTPVGKMVMRATATEGMGPVGKDEDGTAVPFTKADDDNSTGVPVGTELLTLTTRSMSKSFVHVELVLTKKSNSE